LVLGIDVDCCAHLENVGEGLAVQSVINPNTQNLLITDKKGNRIAKAIFTICPEDGYGVYNNVEIKNSIYKNGNGGLISADKISEIERYIYDKVMLATFSFVECYNKEHPNQPLKKFYMGVSDGDLNRLFISAYKKQTSNEDLTIHLNKVHYPNENGLVVYHDPLEKVVIYKNSGSNSCAERE
jgi:hypothetical protein